MKKLLLLTLCAALVACTVPASVNAATDQQSMSAETKELTQENLEEVILKVKTAIDVPKECTEFEYDFMESYRYSFANAIYVLRWDSEDANINIEVSADENGNVLEYYKYVYPSAEGAPKYLKSELEDKADKFVYGLSDEFAGKLRKLDAVSYQKTRYMYRYERIEHDIPMPSNSITVEIDNRTGEICSANVNWLFNEKIDSPVVKITKNQAEEIINKNIEMKLCYMDNITYNDDGSHEIKTFLVYYPDKSYIAVDATTGEVYDTTSEWNEISPANGLASEEKSAADTAGGRGGEAALTEAELEKVEQLKDLISKDKAIGIIRDNKDLLFDKKMISVNASLSTYGNYFEKDKRYVWNIRFNDPTPVNYDTNDYYRSYANATVDARTGEIISYTSSVKSFYDMTPEEVEALKVNYSDKKCRNIFEKFAKAQNKDMFANVMYDSSTKENVIGFMEDNERVYGANGYRYVRINEGVRYASNYIYGSVDSISGKIYNYNYRWYDDVKFDSPKKAISEQKAFNKYMKLEGFDLINEIVTVNNFVDATKLKEAVASDYYFEDEQYFLTFKTRTVYRTDINPYYINAITGEQVDYDGEVYDAGRQTGYNYTDIAGNKYERSIRILADLGIGLEGDKFNPNQVIRRDEFSQMLSDLSFYIRDDSILKGNKNLSRKVAAKAVISCLNLDKVAKLEGIYQTSYSDNKKLDKKYIGYIALADGLKLFDADKNNKFNQNKGLTRAQAAQLLVRLLGVKNLR